MLCPCSVGRGTPAVLVRSRNGLSCGRCAGTLKRAATSTPIEWASWRAAERSWAHPCDQRGGRDSSRRAWRHRWSYCWRRRRCGAAGAGLLKAGVAAPWVMLLEVLVASCWRRCLQGAKARARSTTHVLGPAGTEACVRGSDEVLQRTASQSGSRWLRVLGDTEGHIAPQRLNHGLAHTWWWRAYVVGGLGRDV